MVFRFTSYLRSTLTFTYLTSDIYISVFMEQGPHNFNVTTSNSPNQHCISTLKKLWKNIEQELLLFSKKKCNREWIISSKDTLYLFYINNLHSLKKKIQKIILSLKKWIYNRKKILDFFFFKEIKLFRKTNTPKIGLA